MNSRRTSLEALRHTSAVHAGLWLDKYLARQQQADDSQPRQALVREVATTDVAAEYGAWYARWRDQVLPRLTPPSEGAVLGTVEATALGRMVVGLGAQSALETSIALHRTYGVPYIPGSALKGLAAHYAHRVLGADSERWKHGGGAHQILFGTPESAGYVVFFDAWYVPDSGKPERPNGTRRPLHRDVITVHHAEYYQGNRPPADWDNPTIIPLLSASGRYLLALAGPQRWVERAFGILALALRSDGIGARTSSGYGRLAFQGADEREATPEYTVLAEQATAAGGSAAPRESSGRQQREAQAEFGLWNNQSVIMRKLADLPDGWVELAPKPAKHVPRVRCLLPPEQLEGRQLQPGNDINCRVVALIEREGEWCLVLEWRRKPR
jgi:CRISPR-associated protein Cmr6